MVVADVAVRAVGVWKVYGGGQTRVDALVDVSADFGKGRFTAIMGPSGSGKSTLLHCLAGLDKPSDGKVLLGDVDLTTLPDKQLTHLRRDRIGFVFQAFNLVPTLTALENITLPLDLAGRRPDQEWLTTVIDAIGLSDRLGHKPSELSGGQQQRVACARALVSRPDVVFADEPTGNLDSRTSGEILTLMRSSVDEYGQTTVMVTHDAKAAAMADRVLYLADGEIVKETGRSNQHEILQIIDTLDLQ